MKFDCKHMMTPFRARRDRNLKRIASRNDVGLPEQSGVAAWQRVGSGGALESYGPWTKYQQRRLTRMIIEAASEAADKLMLVRIVANPAFLFRKGRIDRDPVR